MPSQGPLLRMSSALYRELRASARAKPKGVPLRPDGCDRLALGQGLPVTDGPVPRPAVGVVDQAGQVRALAPARPDGHFQGVQGQVRVQARGGLPADDPPGVDVRHEGHVHPAAESTHICDVRHPQLVRPESGEVTVHQVGRALPPSVRTGWCAVTWRGGCRADPCRA